MIRAWIYLRKSRQESGDPDVLSAHRAILLRLAAADGVAIPPDHMIEEVGSGDTLKDRPRFSSLLERFRQSPECSGGLLYCMDVDRLTRGILADRGAVQQALLHAGIRIRTPEGTYDLSRPDDELMYEVRGLLGRQELASYRRRVKIKWEQMTREGELLTGGAPYGYRWDRNERTLVPEPEEFAVVQELFRLAPEISTRRLGPMFGLAPDHVLNILRNPIYTGYPARHCIRFRWKGGQGSAGTRVLKREEFTWPEKPGRYPAAVNRAEWEAVQAVLDERRRCRTKTGSTAGWCRDVVEFEGREEARVQLGSHHAAGTGMYLTYTTIPEEPPRVYVDREIVHAAAWKALLGLVERPQVLAAALLAYRARKAAEALESAPGRTLEALQQELSLARGALARLKEEEAAGDAEDRLANQGAQAAVKVRIEGLKREMGRREVPGVSNELPPALVEALPKVVPALVEEWPGLSEGKRRMLTNALLSAVVVRVTPQPHPTPFLREVVAVRYQPWLGELTDG